MRPRPVVVIDGPSGVGKSTAAKGLAKALGFALVDTGALYRAVASLADTEGVEWEDGVSLRRLVEAHAFAFSLSGALFIDGVEVGDRIRTPRMSLGASVVSRHPEVREELLNVQRRFGERGGVVLEGRDIGTVVFPDAEMKFFLTASARIRAERRFLELKARGEEVIFAEVEQELKRRDDADRNRAVSPLLQAEDAVEIVSDGSTSQEVIHAMLNYVEVRFSLTSNNKA